MVWQAVVRMQGSGGKAERVGDVVDGAARRSVKRPPTWEFPKIGNPNIVP